MIACAELHSRRINAVFSGAYSASFAWMSVISLFPSTCPEVRSTARTGARSTATGSPVEVIPGLLSRIPDGVIKVLPPAAAAFADQLQRIDHLDSIDILGILVADLQFHPQA